MENISTWEAILAGAIAILAIFWMQPGIKATFVRSREAKSDWLGVLVPIALVVLFIMLLIQIT